MKKRKIQFLIHSTKLFFNKGTIVREYHQQQLCRKILLQLNQTKTRKEKKTAYLYF